MGFGLVMNFPIPIEAASVFSRVSPKKPSFFSENYCFALVLVQCEAIIFLKKQGVFFTCLYDYHPLRQKQMPNNPDKHTKRQTKIDKEANQQANRHVNKPERKASGSRHSQPYRHRQGQTPTRTRTRRQTTARPRPRTGTEDVEAHHVAFHS